ncbi:MAG: polyketide synthase dehydratase domain-containing protein [Pirellulales bacterium]|nr:polyketide synthase dehydratase domain-containing protein [Pirellulales bacterium]
MQIERDIAVVGMACIFPKARNLREYWANLAGGVDCISDRPEKRWRFHPNFDFPADHDAFIPFSRGGFLGDDVLFDPVPYGVLPNLVRHGDPDQFFMLHVIDEALRDAKIAESAPVRERTDLIMGRGAYPTGKLVELTLRAEMFEMVLEMVTRGFPGLIDRQRAEIEAFLRRACTPRDIDNVSTAVSNISASRAANRLNLRGAAYAVDAACASSLLAVEQAVWRLRTGQSDLAVASGLFLSMTPSFLYVFTRLGALSPTRTIRPMDRRADGLLVGEGGGAVVLKRWEDALRDGDEVYAVIKGVGSASDGKDVDVLAPASGGQIRCLENAYRDAGVDRDSIGLLELHGTGTIVGDQVEIETVKSFYGRSNQPPTARAMGTVKSMIGHTMPAAGMAAFIKTALALSNKIIPPSLNCEQPREELADCPFYMVTQTRPWIHNPALGPRRAGVNAFGFGGINAHVILEEVAAPATASTVRVPELPSGEAAASAESRVVDNPAAALAPRPFDPGVPRASDLVAFTGASTAELASKIARLERYLASDGTGATLGDIAWSLSRELDFAQPCKLALVSDDLTHLRKLLGRCREGLSAEPQFDDVPEIYYSANSARHEGKVAFILPGMGFPGLIGNYPDHLMELCLHYPDVRAEFDFFENRDRHPEDTVPTSSIFCPPASLPEDYRQKLKKRLAPPKVDDDLDKPQEAGERYLAAMGVTLSNWVGWVLLRDFKIPMDMVTGQSQGEMAALCVVGSADFHETAPSFWRVLNLDTRNAGRQRLAFAWASAEKIEPLLADNPGTYLAIYMAPEGVIFGGDRDGLLRIAETLRQEQILVSILPYPPIHTPGLSHLRAELDSEYGSQHFDLRPPQVDLYSSITAEKYPTDTQGIRDTLMLNVDHPLRIWQTIRKMYEDGARLFVQVGGGHMAAHLERLLPEGARAITAALDVDTRNPLTQLNHLCATILTAGAPLDLSPLFRYRRLRALDFDAPQPEPTRPRMAIPLRIDWSPLYHESVPARDLQTVALAAELSAEVAAPIAPAAGGQSAAAAPASGPIAAPPPPDAMAIPLARLTEAASEPLSNQALAGSEPSSDLLTIDPAVAARLPVLGEIVHWAPNEELRIHRRLDLAEDLFLNDHLFVFNNKPVHECLPVLPLTVSMEFMAEAASILCPGLGLIGFENVRGHRWVGMRDCQWIDITIQARLASVDPETGVARIQCSTIFEDKQSFSVTVLLASEYRQDVHFDLAAPDGGAWPFTTEQVYPLRWMFHGPAFHVVAGLYELGNPAASAALAVRPTDRLFASKPDPLLLTDPCLMDGIGQIIGLWALANSQCILPTGADKVEFYRPTPPIGTVAPIRVEITAVDPDTKKLRANIEIEDGQGSVWVRVSGWTEFVWKWSQKYSDSTRLPSHYLTADVLPVPGLPSGSVCTLTTKQDFRDVDPDWAARIFLSSQEMPAYWALENTKLRRQLVFSRVAAKDAVRQWWHQTHGTLYPFPADLTIGHDAAGRPVLEPAGDPAWPFISLAHTDTTYVALAAGVPVGIDLEPANARAAEIVTHFATEAEAALLASLSATQPDECWPTRLWCAKEAVGKLLGTGLAGRPKDFVAIDADAEGCLLIQYLPTGDRFVVSSLRVDDHILALTAQPGAELAPGGCAHKWSQYEAVSQAAGDMA